MSEPIMIDCEGTGCPPCYVTVEHLCGMCAMCGIPMPLIDDLVVKHKRRDLLAMIGRGDFN